jgi:hypothetical protein
MHNGGFFVLPTIIIHSFIVLLVSIIMVGGRWVQCVREDDC